MPRSQPPPPPTPLPPGIGSSGDYTRLAAARIDVPTLAYIEGGAGEERSLAANRQAFADHALLPRVLTDVGAGHTRIRLLGHDRPHPLLLAPLAWHGLVHPGGETETARGAAAADCPMIISTQAGQPLAAVSAAAGESWFQLYMQPSREATTTLLARARDAGCRAVVVTLDAGIQLPGRRALDAGFRLPWGLQAVNLQGLPAGTPPDPRPGGSRIFQGLLRQAPAWDDLDWLLDTSPLPVLAKGVLHPEDARALQARGIAGLVVSNHGGRGLDGAPASLRCLPGVRAAVGPALPLLFDGGIRCGSDIFQALALGADAVLIGRPQLHALAVAGALGVAHLIKLLREELELTMALTGCTRISDIGPACLCPAGGAPAC